MTKRAAGKFKRRAQDLYDTPESAVVPLIPHLMAANIQSYFEPCCGSRVLVNALLKLYNLDCVWESDAYPNYFDVCRDATKNQYSVATECFPDGVFITNPPWTREILHPIIKNLSAQAPTWLLFDADWMHTKQAIPYLEYCEKIVSVGRVSWMGNGISGFDNCAWYLFDQNKPEPTRFYGRTS